MMISFFTLVLYFHAKQTLILLLTDCCFSSMLLPADGSDPLDGLVSKFSLLCREQTDIHIYLRKKERKKPASVGEATVMPPL